MKILQYAILKNNDEFVNWQNDSKSEIIQVSPMVLDIDGNAGDDGAFGVKTGVGVFVIFRDIV